MKRRFLMITALFCAQLSIAAKIEVTNTNDSGSGSLRWAVSNATWKDTITFSNTTNNSPITLTTGFVLLNKSITIQGNGLGTTILDGNVNSNIFYSDNTGTNNDTINIQKLTIQNGVNTTYGGGGYNDVAGAQHTGFIVNFSEVEVKNCIGRYGGGIRIGMGSLTNCYIHNNIENLGGAGGIDATWYPVNITNTTISNNQGVYHGAASFNGPSNLKNCSIFGNTGTDAAQGRGGLYLSGEMINCTVTNNTGAQIGGVIHTGNSNVKMYNNIIYGNNGGNDVVAFIDFMMGNGLDNATYDKNIVGSCSVLGSSSVNCPIWFSSENPHFDATGPHLNNYGIPSISVECGSIAIDAANSLFAPVKDQNGNLRSSLPDIGAIESGKINNTSVIALDVQLVSAVSGATYQWLDCNNNNAIIQGATSQSFSPASNGSYALEITENGNNCADTSSCYTISVVGLPENELNKEKELIKIIDSIGRESEFKPNTVLIYLYSDGSTERKIKIEE